MATLGAATVETQASTANTTTTFNHEVVAGTAMVLVRISARNHSSGDAAPVGVTLNGIALSSGGGRKNGVRNVQNWYLPAASVPAAGTYSVVVTWPSAGISTAVIAAQNGLVSDGTTFHATPFRGSAIAGAGGVSLATVDVTSEAGDLVVDCLGLDGSRSDIVEGANQTDDFILHAGNGAPSSHTFAGSKELATGTTTTMSWSWATGNVEYNIVASAFITVAAVEEGSVEEDVGISDVVSAVSTILAGAEEDLGISDSWDGEVTLAEGGGSGISVRRSRPCKFARRGWK